MILSAADSRPCPHFGICGGCSLQHLSLADYRDYKQQKIRHFFDRAPISLNHVQVNPMESVLPQTRRRTVLKAYRSTHEVHTGFYQRSSHKIVNVQCCLVIVPEIERLISALRDILAMLLSLHSKAEIFVTKCDQGLDLAVKRSQSSPLTLEQREAAAQFAQEQKLARFTIDDDPLYRAACPTVSFAGFPVEITPESFLQASLMSDEWLARKVCGNIFPGTKKIADLFCGRGTLTLPLTQGGIVYGYEMDQKALEALQKTITRHRLPAKLYNRHLFKEPLSFEEVSLFDTVVLNPPREGAFTQVKQLAQAHVKRIIMVSCNLQTCVRDARILIDGHYELVELSPFDQFLWSDHIEMVAIFDLKG